LTESELFRLSVWNNPTNDVKRPVDLIGATERGLVDTAWQNLIRTVWNVDPAIAIFLTERFKSPFARNEVGRLVRSSPKDVLDVPEAVFFLLGDRFDSSVRRDLKVSF
jgi:phosphatidylinositol 4-kinase